MVVLFIYTGRIVHSVVLSPASTGWLSDIETVRNTPEQPHKHRYRVACGEPLEVRCGGLGPLMPFSPSDSFASRERYPVWPVSL